MQAGQYKQLKAYKAIALQEQRERLINSITSAIRQSLNPAEIFEIASRELGSVLEVGRCIIYRCTPQDADITISHEYRQANFNSLQSTAWPLKHNPLYQWVKAHHSTLAIDNVSGEIEQNLDLTTTLTRLHRWQIRSCLLVPLVHKSRLLGMVELHLNGERHHWSDDEIALTEAIANQLSVALIQAEAYANLEDLNNQLADLERTRSNLIAITGHELRTPPFHHSRLPRKPAQRARHARRAAPGHARHRPHRRRAHAQTRAGLPDPLAARKQPRGMEPRVALFAGVRRFGPEQSALAKLSQRRPGNAN